MQKNKLNEIYKRNYQVELRAEETESEAIIVGRPIVYNSETNIGGMYREIIAKGALDTADLTDVPLFINHDNSKIPLARSRRNNGNSSMTLYIDEEGLTFKAKLDIDSNSEAAALYSAIKRGDISGMSFAFSINTDEWTELDTDLPLRTIKEINKIYEISCVNNPAYSSTSVSIEENNIDKRALDKALSSVVDTMQEAVDTASVELEIEKLKILNKLI